MNGGASDPRGPRDASGDSELRESKRYDDGSSDPSIVSEMRRDEFGGYQVFRRASDSPEKETPTETATGRGLQRADESPTILGKPGTIVWIEGLIGAGKTTATIGLAERLGLRPILEPVDSNPFLELFYRDPKRWAYAMQTYLMRWRFQMQNEAMWASVGNRGAILDRGLPGDRVFAQLNYKLGNMHELEWRAYSEWYDLMVCVLRVPSLLVYLDVDPVTAMDRIRSRGRDAETGIALEYLEALRDGYEELIADIQSGRHAWSQGIEVIRVPWNSDGCDLDRIIQTINNSATGVMS